MQIIKNTKGRSKGRINVKATLYTMEAGETWLATSGTINYNYLTTACSTMTKETGRVFSTSNTVEAKGRITITRVK